LVGRADQKNGRRDLKKSRQPNTGRQQEIGKTKKQESEEMTWKINIR